MHTEYEVRILNVDVEEIKRRLDNIGAKFEWDRLQKRYVYDFIPKIPGKWIRLRTNGVDTTLTIKNLVSSIIKNIEPDIIPSIRIVMIKILIFLFGKIKSFNLVLFFALFFISITHLNIL